MASASLGGAHSDRGVGCRCGGRPLYSDCRAARDPRALLRRVAPGDPGLAQGDTLRFTATPLDAAGGRMNGISVSWTASNPQVATVGQAIGLVTAIGIGAASIVAACGPSTTGAASVTVSPRPIGRVEVVPAATSAVELDSLALAAAVYDDRGAAVVGRPVAWASLEPAIATVNAQGWVSALAPGAARITATVGGKSGQGTVTVLAKPVASINLAPTTAVVPRGEIQPFIVTLRDQVGRVLSGRTVIWSSSAPGIASVSNSGEVTALTIGTGAGGDPRTARAVAIEDAYQFLVQTSSREYGDASFRQQFVTMAEEALRLEGVIGMRGTQQLRTEGTVNGTIAGQALPRLEVVASELQRCDNCQSEVIAYLLFRYPKPAHLRRNPPLRISYAARSLIIPGWGQMAKGQGGKGWALLVFTTLGAGAGAVGYTKQQAALNNAASALTQSDRAGYLEQADQYNRLRLGGFAVAAGVYAFNLIDAVAGPIKVYPLQVVPGQREFGLAVERPFRVRLP